MKGIIYTKGNDIIILKGSYYLDYMSNGEVQVLKTSSSNPVDTIQDYEYTYTINNLSKMELDTNVYIRVTDAFKSYIKLDDQRMFLESIKVGECIYSTKYRIISSYGDLQVQSRDSYVWDWIDIIDVITPNLVEKFNNLKDIQIKAVKKAENLLNANKMVYKNKIKIIQMLKELKHENGTIRVISC